MIACCLPPPGDANSIPLSPSPSQPLLAGLDDDDLAAFGLLDAAPPPPPPVPAALAAAAPPPPPLAITAVVARTPPAHTTPVPLSRWDVDGPLAVAGAGFVAALPGAAAFDAAVFSLSAAEAAATDPQQRLLLEAVGEALLEASAKG